MSMVTENIVDILSIKSVEYSVHTILPPLGIFALDSFSIASGRRKCRGGGFGIPKVSPKYFILISSGTMVQGRVGLGAIKYYR